MKTSPMDTREGKLELPLPLQFLSATLKYMWGKTRNSRGICFIKQKKTQKREKKKRKEISMRVNTDEDERGNRNAKMAGKKVIKHEKGDKYMERRLIS